MCTYIVRALRSYTLLDETCRAEYNTLTGAGSRGSHRLVSFGRRMKDLVYLRTTQRSDPAGMWSPDTAQVMLVDRPGQKYGGHRASSSTTHTRYDSTVLVWHHQHLCDARELGEARPVRACPTGRHHASAVALHAEAVRAVGGVGVGGDIASAETSSSHLKGISSRFRLGGEAKGAWHN